MLAYILYTITVIFILYILYAQFKYRSLAKIPGPPSWPLLGALLQLKDSNKLLQQGVWFFNKFGSTIKIPLGSKMIVATVDKDIIEFFLRSPKFITKAHEYKYLEPWLGQGILNANGLEWQKTRKMLTPAFHFKILEDHCKIFDSSCDVLIDILYDKVGKEAFDIYPLITAFTLDIISETAMGIKINMQKEPKHEYIESVHFMTRIVFKRTLSLWKGNDFLFRFCADYKKQQKAIKILNDMTIKLIQERKEYLLTNQHILEKNGESKKSIFLDILLTSSFHGEPLTDDKIITETTNFMFGGHDTTASTIGIMIYELANNRVVQNKMVEELKTIYGNDRTRNSTMQDLNEMKYMDLVIKEVLRFYSIVPFIGRNIPEDIEYNGLIFPKGITMLFFIYGLNKNPEVFEDPHVFNPERFLNESNMKPYSFIPFSAGPRNCLGQKYAVLEVKATMAKLLRHFELESAGPKHKIELLPEMVMKPSNGIMIKLKRRDF